MAVNAPRRLIQRIALFVGALAVAASCIAHGGTPASKKKTDGIQGATDRALSEYLSRVRQQSEREPHAMGSIWSEDGAFTRLTSDVRAMHAHDLISIVVVEALSASTDGSVKNSRSSSASSQIASLFAKLSASNSMQNLLSQNSASALTAQGQSVTNSTLNTTVGGQVVSVLPNGILVIEAERQVAFNQQTQMIRLRGLVRPSDVNASNQVLSTAVTDLELEVVGKGIINDYTYRQNPLVRFLERLVIF
jgi:flagellar L-ring protein FlgH